MNGNLGEFFDEVQAAIDRAKNKSGNPEVVKLTDEIITTGPFKRKSEYILIGDEVINPDNPYGLVINMEEMLSAQDITDMRTFFTHMPRAILRDFFMKKVWPMLPWDYQSMMDGAKPPFPEYPPISMANPIFVDDPIYGGGHYKKSVEDLVWAAFVNMFNEANLAYINKNNLTPWDWEQEKMDLYTLSQNQEALDSLEKQASADTSLELGLDAKANTIMEQYIALPRLGDTGLEINRQNALKQLLLKKDYVLAQAIVDAYRYAGETVIGADLTKKIPMDIVAEDGRTIVTQSE